MSDLIGNNIDQHVYYDPHNSSTANLNSGASFTGIATSTLGVNAIQVSLKTDQDCTVKVQQSPDNSNWDIVDTFTYTFSNGGNSWTVQAVNSWYRVIVTNANGTTTTYFRLQSVLCPVVEAIPRAPSADGRLITQARLVDDYGFDVENTPDSEIKVAQSVKLAGGVFIGTVVDPNFWVTSVANGGTVFQDTRTATSGGELTIQTNTTANAVAIVSSLRRGRYVAGNSNFARYIVHLPDTGATNNQRRWGLADYSTITSITDGAYYQLNSTTFSVATMRGGTATVVSNGSFNGNYGASYTVDINTVHVYEIYYTTFAVYFTIDGRILHTIQSAAAPWTNTPTLYLYADNVNSAGGTANVLIHVRSSNIHRLGPTESATKYAHISAATTTVCKYGAGYIHSVILNEPGKASVITLFDSTTSTGNVIANINTGAGAAPVPIPYNTDFYTGLTVFTGASSDVTITYE